MTKKIKDETTNEYAAEYRRWYNKLEPIWASRFDRNYKQYTAYTEVKGTKSRISDPVAPELTERQVRRLFEKDPVFFALGRGKNIPKPVTELLANIVKYYWTNPEMVMSTGTMKSKLKVSGREFCVLGNTVVEAYYNSVSDSPDMRVHACEDVIFNPAYTLKTSPVHYVRQCVDISYLEDHKEVEIDGVKSGLFKNIEEVKAQFEDVKEKSRSDVVNRGDSNASFEAPIELISRYKGSSVCRFILNATDKDEPIKIQEYKSDILGESPLAFAMDIEIPKQPYAISYLDFINGLTQAKDLTLNQIVDYGAKALNPPLFYDPSTLPINKLALQNAYKLGGLVPVNPQMADHKNMPPINTVGFQLLEYIQQRSESVTGSSAYTDGTTNNPSDKTQGTATGISVLTSQAQGPIRDRQQTLEESIVEPIVNKWLKMAAGLMSENEIKYAFISGQSSKWIEFTKGMLSGKITLNDLLVSELITPEEAAELAAILEAEGKNPQTELIFDVDWIIRCESGSMAEIDTEKEIQNFQKWVDFNMSIGLQMDLQKVSDELASKANIKDPERFKLQGVQNGGIGQGLPNEVTGGIGEGAPGVGGVPSQTIGQVGGLPSA